METVLCTHPLGLYSKAAQGAPGVSAVGKRWQLTLGLLSHAVTLRMLCLCRDDGRGEEGDLLG